MVVMKPEPNPQATSEATQIAEFMELPNWNKVDDLGLVNRVSAGFPARTASIVVKRIDPYGRFVKATDLIPKSTLHRRGEHALSQHESEKILAVSRLFLEVLRLYRDDGDRAARFLVQPHPMLGNESPIEIAKGSIAGAALVMKLLAQADAGIAA